MATLSHEAFRRCVENFGGCDEYFNEMINAGSLIHMGQWEKYYLLAGPAPQKIVWQLIGSKIDYMEVAAKILSEQPGIGIDLNMGCCAPQIANTGAGISWMTKPIEQTQAMVHAVKSAISNAAKDGVTEKRLSVKLRLGDEKFTDEGFFSFCDMLVKEGVQMITLHPRTKKERYRTRPRWEYAEKLAKKYKEKIPIILNGDIKDAESFSIARSIAPSVSGIMIARAAAQKPWIFKELTMTNKKSTQIDCESLALRFIDDMEECQPKEFYKTRLQRFFAYYCLNFSFAHYFQTQMLNAKDNNEARSRIREYFKKCPNDKIKII